VIRPRLLVVDDDAASCEAVAEALRAEGYEVATARGGRAALTLTAEQVFDVVVSDIRMPDLDGLGLLRGLRDATPEASVILMTAFGTVEAALQAIKDGAYDYVSKPLRLDELLLTVRRALEQRRLVRENQQFRQTLQERYHLENIVGVGCEADRKRSDLALLPRAVEDDHTTGSARGDEARERIHELSAVGEVARVQEVVPVEEVQRRFGHGYRPNHCAGAGFRTKLQVVTCATSCHVGGALRRGARRRRR